VYYSHQKKLDKR